MSNDYDDPYLYDLRTAGFTDDLRLFQREAARYGEPVLELGCGTGRIAVELRRRGIQVVGLDRDVAMLRRAQHNAAEAGVELPLVRADMTRFAFEPRFGLVFVAFASYHDLPTLAAWEASMRCVRAVLRPGGCLLLDERTPPPETGLEPRFFRTIKAPDGSHIDCYHCLELDREEQRTRGELRYHIRRPGEIEELKRFPFEGTYAHREQIEAMLARSGFEVREIQGGYNGHPYREGSPRMIFLAEPV